MAQPGPSGVVARLEPVSDLPAHSYQADPSTPQSDPTGHAPYPQHGWNLTQGFQQIQEPYTPQGYNPNEPPTYHISLPMGNYPIFQPLPSQHDPTQNIQPEPEDELYQNAWTVQGQTTHCYPPTASHSTHPSYSVDYSTALVPQGNSQTTTQMNAHQGPYHQPHHYGSQTQQHYSSHAHMTQSRPGDVGLSDNQTWSGNSRLLPIDLSRSNDHTHGASQRADLTHQFYHGQQYQQLAHTSQRKDIQYGAMTPENHSKSQKTRKKDKKGYFCECNAYCPYKDFKFRLRDYKNHMQAISDQKRKYGCAGTISAADQGDVKAPCPFKASTRAEINGHMASVHSRCTLEECEQRRSHKSMHELVIHIIKEHYNKGATKEQTINIASLSPGQLKFLKDHKIFKCRNGGCTQFSVQAKNIQSHQYTCKPPPKEESNELPSKQPAQEDEKPFQCEYKKWNGYKWEHCKTSYARASSLFKHYVGHHKAECYFRFFVCYECGDNRTTEVKHAYDKGGRVFCLLCNEENDLTQQIHVPVAYSTVMRLDKALIEAHNPKPKPGQHDTADSETFAKRHSEHWRAVVSYMYTNRLQRSSTSVEGGCAKRPTLPFNSSMEDNPLKPTAQEEQAV